MRVLLTYARHSKTLAAVRSIGKSGRDVVVTDDFAWTPSSFSKYCNEAVQTSSPKSDPSQFVKDLSNAVSEFSVDLVIPMDDPECDILSESQWPSAMKASIALPQASAYAAARNKDRTYTLAEELGIPVPRTITIETPDAVDSILESLQVPFIVKPARSSGSRGFAVIGNRESINRVTELLNLHGTLLAQEFIPHGGSIGVSYLFNHGDIRAFFTHRRVIEYPSTGGPSIIRESIRHDEAERLGRVILEELDWHGVAMVEFRLDQRSGKPVLIEINPRFWGSLPLAIHCGVDFPKLLCDIYEKGDTATVMDYSTGRRCMNLFPLGVASVFGSPDVHTILEILRHVGKKNCLDVESFDDPLPWVGATFTLMRYLFSSSRAQDFLRKAR